MLLSIYFNKSWFPMQIHWKDHKKISKKKQIYLKAGNNFFFFFVSDGKLGW